jgi:hypothetical protein
MMICGDLLKKLVEFAGINCIISQKLMIIMSNRLRKQMVSFGFSKSQKII